jgi:uncharacterized membrane-anchored protein
MVVGEDARKLLEIAKEPAQPGLEGWIASDDFVHEFGFLSFNEEGHISVEDWSEIDPAAMLKEISDKTEQSNLERRKNGSNRLHVTGWLQQPTLDRVTNTVYWTFGARGDDNIELINSVALRLGRTGFEKLVWITDKPHFIPAGGGGELDVMLRAHNFDPGHRYADFTTGDKVAAYGVAGLVASVAGVKLAKVAAAAGGLILLKKFGAILLLPFLFLFGYIKRLFTRKPKPLP